MSPRNRRPRAVRVRTTSRRTVEGLGPRERVEYERSLEALRYMREDGLSRARAARRGGVSTRTLDRYVGSALHRTRPRAPWRARRGDRLVRPMVVISHGREVEVLVAGSRKASAVGAYHNAVAKALGGNDVPLKTLSGLTVDTFELETDVEVLQELGDRFELDFDSIYSLSR